MSFNDSAILLLYLSPVRSQEFNRQLFPTGSLTSSGVCCNIIFWSKKKHKKIGMASPITVKAFKYDSAQQPILSVIETPLKYGSFAHHNQIDLSFSSYVKQEKSEHSTPGVNCAMDDSEINVFDAQKYFSESNDPKESKEVLSPSNLKHITEPIDSVSRLSSVSSIDGYSRNFRVRSFHATPTASSEASWNSQTGLLSNPPGSVPVSLRNPSADLNKKRSGSSTTKWFFCRKCPCSGKKSVQVQEGISENKEVNTKCKTNTKVHSHQKSYSQRTNEMVDNSSNMSQETISKIIESPYTQRKVPSNPSKLQPVNQFIMPNTVTQHRLPASTRPFTDNSGLVGGFSFPILKNTPHGAARPDSNSSPKTSTCSPLEEPPRESLEVFQPPDSSNFRKSIEDDAGSDASSDLFEIESFSTQTTSIYPIYRRRDSLDDAPTLNARRLAASSNTLETVYCRRSSIDEPMTPRTECYAPSEASIDWSVTTAEGCDKASVTNFSITASEIEELSSFRHKSSMEKNGEEAAWNSYSHGKKKLGNGLLSCRHEKAVNVGPHPLKCPQEGPPLQLISTSSHVSAASRPPKPSMPPASSRSNAGRLSIAFVA